MQGIKRDTDYASRIVFHLASLGAEARVRVNDVAERRLMPGPFVRRVVARLAAAGILRTSRGSGGGVRLARPAETITLLDVVRAMEGGVVLNRCVTEPRSCPLAEVCPVQRAWGEATLRAEESLEGVTFADLLASSPPTSAARDAAPAKTAARATRRGKP